MNFRCSAAATQATSSEDIGECLGLFCFLCVRACLCVSLFIPYLEDLAFSTKQYPDEELKVPSAIVYVLLSWIQGVRAIYSLGLNFCWKGCFIQ